MIYYSIPWDSNKNIADAYNRVMETLPSDDDFACFIDADAMFLHPMFGKQLSDIVHKYPDCGLFTATTNRIGCDWQRAGAIGSDDIKDHREFAHSVYQVQYDSVTEAPHASTKKLMSGVLIMIKKSLWKKIGGFKGDGMLGVDNQLHIDVSNAGEKILLMDGVYIYHWYRGGNKSDIAHLVKDTDEDLVKKRLTERAHQISQRKLKDKEDYYKRINDFDYDNQNVPKFTKPNKPLKKIIYSAITGDYDQPLMHKIPEGWEYKLFSNNKKIPATDYVTSQHLTDVQLARNIKICPWDYFDFDVCLWIDGNTVFDANEIEALTDYEFVISRHSERDCMYEEGNAIVKFKKEKPEMINNILMRYKQEGLPEHNGMVASHAIVRWNTEKNKNFCKEWWNELVHGTHRDQMSFNYVLWKNPMDIFYVKFRTIFKTTSIHRTKVE